MDRQALKNIDILLTQKYEKRKTFYAFKSQYKFVTPLTRFSFHG
jgi:hypothetical protein